MKLRLTNYDTSEYKQFEDMLNNLSKSGYNCKSVDMFTVFKKDEQRFYYKADIFVPQKKSSKNNREQRDQWLLKYVNHGYEFIGKSRKIYVFKAAQAANIKGTDQALLLTYFKRNKTISNIIFIFVAMLLSFLLIPSVFANQNPMEFITNGSIILHYIPLLFCPALLIRFFNHHLTTEKIKLTLSNKKANNKISKYPFIISNWLLIVSIVLIIAGFSIDFIGRETLPLNDRIITLSALGLSSNNDEYNTFNKSSSLMIKEAISYNEENDNDALIVNYYYYNSEKKAKNALNDYLNSVNFKNKKQITNGYLLSNDSIYNCIAFVKNKRLIIVQTTVDLLENNTYQKITSFNY